MISRLPEGPSAEDRAAVRFTIVCDVTRGAEDAGAASIAAATSTGSPRPSSSKRRPDRRRRAASPAPAASRRRRRSSRGSSSTALGRFEIEWEVGGREPREARRGRGLTGFGRAAPAVGPRSASRRERRPEPRAAPPAVSRCSSGSRPRAGDRARTRSIDRCENCGLVGRPRRRPRPPSRRWPRCWRRQRQTAGDAAIRAPNAASLQAWLGAENWAALRPGDARAQALAAGRRAAARQARPARSTRSPPPGQRRAWPRCGRRC